MPAHLPEQAQRVVHELVGEPRLLGDAARRDQVHDPVRLHVHALDAALADQALQIDVGQAERDAQFGGEAALSDARVLLDGIEQPQIAAGFDVHVEPIHRGSHADRGRSQWWMDAGQTPALSVTEPWLVSREREAIWTARRGSVQIPNGYYSRKMAASRVPRRPLAGRGPSGS